MCSVSCNCDGKQNNQELKSFSKWTWKLPALGTDPPGCSALGMEYGMEYDCSHFSVEISSRWNVLSQWEMKVIFLLPILFCVANPVPVILDADSFLEAGGFWKTFGSLANDKAEDLCSAAPTQTFWQSVEVSVSSLSQWEEYFATGLPLCHCYCDFASAQLLEQPWFCSLALGKTTMVWGKTCFSYGHKFSSSCSFVLMKMQRV